MKLNVMITSNYSSIPSCIRPITFGILISLALMTLACSKDEPIEPPTTPPTNSSQQAPTHIEISFADGAGWRKVYAYYFSSDSVNNTETVSFINYSGGPINMTKKTFFLSTANKLVNKILLQYYSFHLGDTIGVNSATQELVYQDNQLFPSNIKIAYSHEIDGTNPYSTYLVKTYPGNIAGFEINTVTSDQGEEFRVGYTQDSVLWITGKANLWGSEFEYYIPGYKNKEYSEQNYFLNKKQACTTYIYENGWILNGFHVTARRKMNFYYDENYDALAQAFKKIDPRNFSPHGSIADSHLPGFPFSISFVRNFFENTCSSYTDSVFKFDQNNVKTLQYTETHTHQVTKDTKGRITTMLRQSKVNNYRTRISFYYKD